MLLLWRVRRSFQVHDLCCLPDRALTDAMFDCARTAVQVYVGKSSRSGSMAMRSAGAKLPAAGGAGPASPGFARFASRRMVVEDMEGSPDGTAPSVGAGAGAGAGGDQDLPRDESGSHVFITSPDEAAGGGGAVIAAEQEAPSPHRGNIVIHSRMLPGTPKTRFQAFDDTELQTITDEDETKTRTCLPACPASAQRPCADDAPWLLHSSQVTTATRSPGTASWRPSTKCSISWMAAASHQTRRRLTATLLRSVSIAKAAARKP